MQFNPSIHNPWWRFWLRWQEFCRILYLLEYESRMRKLVAWAKRKRLQGVGEHYQDRLVAAETELMRCRWRHPKTVIFCEFLYTAYRQIWPDKPPHHHRPRGRQRRRRHR